MDLLPLIQSAADLAGVKVTLRRPDLDDVTVGAGEAQGPTTSASTSEGTTVIAQDVVEPPRPAVLEAVVRFAADLVTAHEAGEAEAAALADELLERYEEITLLYELSRELVAVFDESEACATVLGRAATVMPVRYGEVVLVDEKARTTRRGAAIGVATAPQAALVRGLAARAVGGGLPLLRDRGQLWEGEPLDGPALAVPLSVGSTDPGVLPFGALVLLGEGQDRFTAGEASLASTVALQLATVVANGRLVASLREKERIEKEVEIAASVQRQLLPTRAPQLPGVTVQALCLPAASVGGDYFDFVGDGHVVTALVADVSGHGIGPGLMMAMTRTALRRELKDNTPLPTALTSVNTLMWDDMLATGLFITLFCIRYDSHTGVLSYVNAGHHPALLRRADGEVEPLDGDGYPLGLIPDPVFDERSVRLHEGDAVLLFTDGIVEERCAGGEMFGSTRLTETVAKAERQVMPRVLEAVDAFRGEAPQQDDITMLELRRDTAAGGRDE